MMLAATGSHGDGCVRVLMRIDSELVDELSAVARASGYAAMLAWGRAIDGERAWALEDVRGVSRGLERFSVEHDELVVRVPPNLMAHARKSARTYGKSDSIDAHAIARAALAHPSCRQPRKTMRP